MPFFHTQKAFIKAIKSGDSQTVADFLSCKNGWQNLQFDDGKTPLHLAVISKQLDIVKMLLAKNCYIRCDQKSKSPLHHAAEAGSGEILQEILKKSSSHEVNYADTHKMTPVHYAIEKNDAAALKILLDTGKADLRRKSTMATTSTATKKATDELIEQALQKTKKTAVKTEKKEESVVEKQFADIGTNTFYKIIIEDGEASPQKKQELVTQALTYNAEQTKEENITRLKEFDLFKQWVQHQRKLLAERVIKATDPRVFGEMKEVIDQMNGGLLEFEESMRPLVETVEAIYRLRQAGDGTTYGVYKEIKDEEAAKGKRDADIKEKGDEMAALKQRLNGIEKDIAVLGTQKNWWILGGGLKKEAVEGIAGKKQDAKAATEEMQRLAGEIETLKAPPTSESQYASLAAEKEKLRELLAISAPEHQERQQRLINAALNYVNTTEERVTSIMTHFGKLEQNLETLDQANSGMQTVYAILVDSTSEAVGKTRDTRAGFLPKEGVEEGSVEKLMRESKVKAIDDYAKVMNSQAVDTSMTFKEVVQEANTIATMKTTTRDQIDATSQMKSSGVAGVASRLSGVLTAVNNAAITESTEATRQNLSLMNDKTNYVNMQESIKAAMGLQGVNNSMTKALDELDQVVKGVKATTAITTEQMKGITENREKLEEMSRVLQEAMADSRAAISEAGAEVRETFTKVANDDKKKPEGKKPAADPFAKLGAN